jgi:ubiquinone/menaquinone biosynthesis C-methylase UbiE
MAIMACRLLRPQKIVGIDISDRMLELGRNKVEKEDLHHLSNYREAIVRQ